MGMEAMNLPFGVQVPALDMQEKPYDIEGKQGTSRKLEVQVMGGTHVIKFDGEQFKKFGGLHGQPALIKGVVGFTKKGIPELRLTDISEVRKAA